MKGMVPPDKGSKISQQRYAVIYVPKRSRNRFPAGSVEIFDDEAEAMYQSDPENKRYAAVVHGPSKSSEGQLLYYLIEWLDSFE
jgi:hypothetical protein